MRIITATAVVILTLISSVRADNPPEMIYDEGTRQGVAYRLNCVGSGISCTQSGITGTLTVNGGGGGSGTVGIGTTGRMVVQIGSTTTGTPYNNNLDSNGNLGIGSLTPGKLLDVNGTMRAVAFSGGETTTTQTASDSSTKIATTAYVTGAISTAIAGVNPAVAVQAATTAASDTSGFTYSNGVSGIGATFTGSVNTAVTIDGYTFTAVGQRLLVKNDTQSPSGAFNGVYYVTQIQTAILAPILTRALDYDMPSDINNTGAIPVINGTVNGSTTWVITSSVSTVGTDPLTYVEFSLNPSVVVQTSRTISTTSPLAGGGDLSSNRTFSIANAAADGSTKGAASFNATDFTASSGNITLASIYKGWSYTSPNVSLATITDSVGIGTTLAQGGLAIMSRNLGIGTWAPQAALVVMSGNVGIGSKTPGQALDINGTIRSIASGNSTFGGNVGIGTWITNQLTVDGGVSIGTAASIYEQTVAPAGGMFMQGNLGVGTTFVLERFSVIGGNAGIGTFSPIGLFEVGTGNAPNFIAVGNNVAIGTKAAGSLLVVGSTGQTTFGATGNIGISTSSTTNAALVVMGGNTGFGTWVPANTIDVLGNAVLGTYAGVVANAGPTNGLALSGNIGVGTWTSNANKITVYGGNVGIGTVTTTSILNLNGGITALGIGTTNVRILCIDANHKIGAMAVGATGACTVPSN